MNDLGTIAIMVYLAGVVGCGMAGDKRTIGAAGAAALALFATPLVGAVLLLSWPTRMEAEAYYKAKSEEARTKIGQ